MERIDLKTGLLCLGLLLQVTPLLSQNEVLRLPLQYGQFYSSYPLYNPASMGVLSSIQMDAGTQLLTGPWSNIYNFYAHGEVQLTPERRNRNLSNHILGFNFNGDKEGDLLSRSRFYLQYAVHVNLKEKLTLSAGASIGFMSFVIAGSPVSGGGADTDLDLNLGMWLYGDRYQTGISVNQLPQSEVTPLAEVSKLTRYWNVTGEYRFDLSYQTTLISSGLLRWVPAQNDLTVFDLHARILLKSLVSAGASYRYRRGLGFLVGLENIRLRDGKLFTRFVFNIPAGTDRFSNVNTVEWTLGYGIRPYRTD